LTYDGVEGEGSILVGHKLTFSGVKREMVVFFLFLKSDSLGGRKLCFSIVIARKAKTVFFFCVILISWTTSKISIVKS